MITILKLILRKVDDFNYMERPPLTNNINVNDLLYFKAYCSTKMLFVSFPWGSIFGALQYFGSCITPFSQYSLSRGTSLQLLRDAMKITHALIDSGYKDERVGRESSYARLSATCTAVSALLDGPP